MGKCDERSLTYQLSIRPDFGLSVPAGRQTQERANCSLLWPQCLCASVVKCFWKVIPFTPAPRFAKSSAHFLMNEAHIQKIAGELKVQPRQVLATAKLFSEGATVPFISRYRKEATGSLDEVAITNIRERLLALAELDSRREAILKSLAERNLLTDQLKADIAAADNITRLEDIFQPFRPKRRTRAMIAKEQGLEPLADLLSQQQTTTDPLVEAAKYVSAEKGVADANAALAGARDIIAERISDD